MHHGDDHDDTRSDSCAFDAHSETAAERTATATGFI